MARDSSCLAAGASRSALQMVAGLVFKPPELTVAKRGKASGGPINWLNNSATYAVDWFGMALRRPSNWGRLRYRLGQYSAEAELFGRVRAGA